MPRRPHEEPPPPRRYDWVRWATEGGWWAFQHGMDYTISTRDFASVARNWAARNGYDVSVRATEHGCVIRFTPIRTEQP